MTKRRRRRRRGVTALTTSFTASLRSAVRAQPFPTVLLLIGLPQIRLYLMYSCDSCTALLSPRSLQTRRVPLFSKTAVPTDADPTLIFKQFSRGAEPGRCKQKFPFPACIWRHGINPREDEEIRSREEDFALLQQLLVHVPLSKNI